MNAKKIAKLLRQQAALSVAMAAEFEAMAEGDGLGANDGGATKTPRKPRLEREPLTPPVITDIDRERARRSLRKVGALP